METLHEWAENYDGNCVFHIGITPKLLLGDPQSVADVLINDVDSYCKKSSPPALIPILTEDRKFVAPKQRSGTSLECQFREGWPR